MIETLKASLALVQAQRKGDVVTALENITAELAKLTLEEIDAEISAASARLTLMTLVRKSKVPTTRTRRMRVAKPEAEAAPRRPGRQRKQPASEPLPFSAAAAPAGNGE